MSLTGIQLYSLRNRPEPLTDLFHEIANAGFDGVEFAGDFREIPSEVLSATFEGTGLSPIAAHVDLTDLEAMSAAERERYTAAGIDTFVIPHLPIDRFRTQAHLDALSDDLARLRDTLAADDINLLVHSTRELLLPFLSRPGISRFMRRDGLPRGAYNHAAWAASKPVNRSAVAFHHHTPLGQLADSVDSIGFEIDAKSAATAGFSLDLVLRELDNRVPCVHLSDVRRSRRFPPAYEPVYPGEGIVDPARVARICRRRGIPWLITEHDDPSDPSEAIQRLAADLPVSEPLAEESRPSPV